MTVISVFPRQTMASNEPAASLEQKKIIKRKKENYRVEQLGIAHQELASKIGMITRTHGRRKPSRLVVLEHAISYIKTLKKRSAEMPKMPGCTGTAEVELRSQGYGADVFPSQQVSFNYYPAIFHN